VTAESAHLSYGCESHLRCHSSGITDQLADIDGRRHLRSARRGLLDVPRVELSTYGRRSFSYAGPSAWNALPDYLKNSTLSLSVFRNQLKHFLFSSYYHSQRVRGYYGNALYKLLTYLLTYLLTSTASSSFATDSSKQANKHGVYWEGILMQSLVPYHTHAMLHFWNNVGLLAFHFQFYETIYWLYYNQNQQYLLGVLNLTRCLSDQSRFTVLPSPAAASNNSDLAAATHFSAMYINRQRGR